jgi:hypothetical protein
MTEGAKLPSVPRGGTTDFTAGPQARPQVKRRNFFVKKRLQARYIIYYLAIMMIGGFALFDLMQRHAHRALYLEMRQGHSTVFDTWSILEPQIVRANVIVILAVVAVAAATTLVVTRAVHRASVLLASNLGAWMRGLPAEHWAAIRHPAEFQHLQDRLAKALSDYQDRVAVIRREVADLGRGARAVRERAAAGAVSDRDIEELRAGFARVTRHFGSAAEEGGRES